MGKFLNWLMGQSGKNRNRGLKFAKKVKRVNGNGETAEGVQE
jgi:hypothetical protein